VFDRDRVIAGSARAEPGTVSPARRGGLPRGVVASRAHAASTADSESEGSEWP
jgi:hypothetical protein